MDEVERANAFRRSRSVSESRSSAWCRLTQNLILGREQPLEIVSFRALPRLFPTISILSLLLHRGFIIERSHYLSLSNPRILQIVDASCQNYYVVATVALTSYLESLARLYLNSRVLFITNRRFTSYMTNRFEPNIFT